MLVVEDETSLRSMIQEVLEEAGCTVLAAGSSEDALAVARAHGGTIDALVTDLVLPRMGGRELAAQVAAMHTALRVLFMSGYTEDYAAERAPSEGAQFLQKPFTLERLVESVGALLADGAR